MTQRTPRHRIDVRHVFRGVIAPLKTSSIAFGVVSSLLLSPASFALSSGPGPSAPSSVAHPSDAPVVLAKKKRRRRTRKKKPAGEQDAKTTDAPAAAPAKTLYVKGVGFSVRPLSREEQQQYRRKGLIVSALQKELPAAKSGLRDDDIITSFDGKSVDDTQAFVDALLGGDEGQTFKLLVVRAGVDTSVDLRLPGESAEEREEREKKEREKEEQEQQKRDEKEKREQEERDREEREDAEREAREQREEEAEQARKDAAEEAEEEEDRLRELEEAKEDYDEAIEEVTEDKFGLLECLVCSFCLPTFTPVWVIVMLLVDNDTPTQRRHHDNGIPEEADAEVTVVNY